MDRLLITGDTGLLGFGIAAKALREYEVCGASRASDEGSLGWAHAAVDLLNHCATSRLLAEIRPHVIIHCAAATDVERCEENPNGAYALNIGATERLAGWAAQNGAQFAYVSTDSVFDGSRGKYREQDSPNPLNAYARSKAEGERVARERCPEALILRTNFFGWNNSAKPNIGKWMCARLMSAQPFAAFADVRFSPLFVEDLAKLILDLVSRNAMGIFHVAAGDSCTKHEFACRLGSALQLNASNVTSTLLENTSFRATRPRDTSLTVAKCVAFLEKEMPSVQQGIAAFANALVKSVALPIEKNRIIERPIPLSAH